jgi:hypothetical protein
MAYVVIRTRRSPKVARLHAADCIYCSGDAGPSFRFAETSEMSSPFETQSAARAHAKANGVTRIAPCRYCRPGLGNRLASPSDRIG